MLTANALTEDQSLSLDLLRALSAQAVLVGHALSFFGIYPNIKDGCAFYVISVGRQLRRVRTRLRVRTNDSNGRNLDADHDWALTDEGPDHGGINITPRTSEEHTQRHVDNGDYRRWNERRQIEPE